jgi:hypothetical protein
VTRWLCESEVCGLGPIAASGAVALIPVTRILSPVCEIVCHNKCRPFQRRTGSRKFKGHPPRGPLDHAPAFALLRRLGEGGWRCVRRCAALKDVMPAHQARVLESSYESSVIPMPQPGPGRGYWGQMPLNLHRRDTEDTENAANKNSAFSVPLWCFMARPSLLDALPSTSGTSPFRCQTVPNSAISHSAPDHSAFEFRISFEFRVSDFEFDINAKSSPATI